MSSRTLITVSKLRERLTSLFIDKENEIEAVIVGLLSGVPTILIGPYGAAKTSLVRTLTKFIGGRCFTYLLTPLTDLSEIFGPIDIKLLQEKGLYKRVTRGKLPEAHVAFFDEIFKAGSAILNALLEIIESRTYYDGYEEIKCPLIAIYAASNETPPEGDTVKQAVFDRFRVRCFTKYVDPAFTFDLADASHSIRRSKIEPVLTPEEVASIQSQVDTFAAKVVSRHPGVRRVFSELLAKTGIQLSDRAKAVYPRIVAATMLFYLSEEVTPLIAADAFLMLAPSSEEEVERVISAIESSGITSRFSVKRDLMEKVRRAQHILDRCLSDGCTRNDITEARTLIDTIKSTVIRLRIPHLASILRKLEDLEAQLARAEALARRRRA